LAAPDTEELETAPLPVPAPETPAAPPKTRRWRGITGSLAFGLTALAVVVLAAGVLCAFTGAPGPGTVPLIAHPVAAVLALAAQHFADRRRGLPAGFAGAAVVALTAATLWFFWWA
jgi:hypothetical protein